jgi:hypothetical protein
MVEGDFFTLIDFDQVESRGVDDTFDTKGFANTLAEGGFTTTHIPDSLDDFSTVESGDKLRGNLLGLFR